MKKQQNLLKDVEQLKQEVDALKLLCDKKDAENKKLHKSIDTLEWMLKPKQTATTDFTPEYGDLSDLNINGLIKKSIPKHQLQDIVSEYLDLMETSAAIYEKNGDYVLGIFSSGWCRMMDEASRRICNTDDNREALANGKWLCHESCWKDASLKSMIEGKVIEVACHGGINLYAVPVWANKQVIGAISFGFGSPPKEDAELKKLSKKYKIPLADLRKQANAYKDRPPFVVDYAKQRIEKSAQYLGYLVERKIEKDRIEEIKEQHRTTFNSIGDGVITTDKKGRITNINPAAESYCGWTYDEALNKPFSEVFRIVNAKTRKPVADPVQKVLKSKKVVGLANHTVLVSKNGKEYQIADTAAPIKNKKGNITGVVLVFSDVTDKYRAEQLLEVTKERYRIISETTSDFTFSCIKVKKGCEIDWMAGAVKKITGYSFNDIKANKCWRFMVHPDDDHLFVKHALSLKPGEESQCELRILDPGGIEKWLSVSTMCLLDENKKKQKIYGGCEDITAHKKAEKELLKTQKTVDKSPLSIFWISPEGKFTYVNEAATKKLGYSRKELLSMYVWDIDPNYPQETRKEQFNLHRKHESRILESEHKRADGSTFPVKINSYYLSFEDQEMEIAEVEDITVHKKAQEKLHFQSEILDQIGDLVTVTDFDGTILYANQAECDSIGIPKEQIIGKSIEVFGEDDTQGASQKEILETTLKKGSWRGEVINYEKKGNIAKILDCRTWLLLDSNNSAKGIIGVSSDITTQKQIEKALRKSEEHHRRLFETMSQGVLYQAADGVIKSVNPAAERMLGLSANKIIGKTHLSPRWKMITEDGQEVPGTEHPSMLVLKTGKKMGPVIRGFYIPDKDEYVWLSITATPLFKPGEDKPYQSYAVFDNITFRKKQEDALKKQQQLIKAILNKLPIGIAINTSGPEPKVELVNDNFAKIYGIKTKDLTTVDSFWESVYEDKTFREKIKNKVLSDISSGDPERMQWNDIPITKKGKIVKYVSAQNISLDDYGLIISTVMDTTERKLAENEIIKAKNKAEESRLRFETLFAESPVSILIQDKDTGKIIDANKTAYTAYGFDSIESLQKNDFWMAPPYSLKDSLEMIKKARSEGNHVFEWKSRKISGEIFWELVTLRPIVIDGKERMLATTIDITEQKLKQMEQQVLYEIANATFQSDDVEALLANIKNILSKLIDTNNFYVAIYDKERDMFSIPYEADEKDQIESWPAGKSVAGLVVRKKQSLLLKKPEILKMMESGEIEQIGNMCEVWLGVPLFSGTDIMGVLVVQDYHNPNAYEQGSKEILEFVSSQISMAYQKKRFIEDLVLTKERAEESEKKTQSILDNMLDLVAIADLQGNYKAASPSHKILGYDIDWFIGKNVLDFVHPDDFPQIQSKLSSILKEKATKTQKVRYRYLCSDGSYLWFETIGHVICDENDKPLEFLFNTRDITEQKKAEEELRIAKEKAQESDRLKTAFLANMSHEIRTPMNGIIGFTDLLKEPNLSHDQQKEYIEIIEQSGERLLNIINNIVDISKIEAGVMEVDLKESNINEQLEYIYNFFKPEVDKKGLLLILLKRMTTEHEKVITDRELLIGVLTNLIKNAIKYTEVGFIEFGCILKGSCLEFFVKDTGIGISKDRQQAIFERFIKADIEDKKARQGAGLGLSISKAYAEMLGGEIWVESQEGEGATFYFTIPYRKEQQKTHLQTTDEPKIINKGQHLSLKILIVEDDELSSILMLNQLQSVSKEVLRAHTGSEAITMCKEHPDIDLILMDMKMPGMDGEEATKQIRKFNKEVVIIAQTANAFTGDREKMLLAGCNNYIAKPILKKELQELIQKYFAI